MLSSPHGAWARREGRNTTRCHERVISLGAPPDSVMLSRRRSISRWQALRFFGAGAPQNDGGGLARRGGRYGNLPYGSPKISDAPGESLRWTVNYGITHLR
jgi:hypothetical protein